jgi:hypothetical protein
MRFPDRQAMLLTATVLTMSCSTATPTPTSVPTRAHTPTTAPAATAAPTPSRTPTPTIAPTVTRTPTRAPSPTPTLVLPSQCPQGCTTHVQGCDIKGNIADTGEKIYHIVTSGSYTRTLITADKGERWFCNVVEAQAAGWRPSEN